jgi:multiple sugar transport system substrate-binding protein
MLSTFGDAGFDKNDNNRPIFDKEDNKLRNVLQLLKEMFDSGILNPSSLTATDHDCITIMAAGQATFTMGGEYNLKTLNDPAQSAEAGNIKAMLNPGGVEGVRSGAQAYIRFYAITENSDQKEDAWKLVKFLGWKDKNGEYYVPKKWALKFGLGFVQKGMFNDSEVEQSMKKWVDPNIIVEQYKYVVDSSYKFTPWYMEWTAIATGEFQKAMLGKETIDNVLNNLAKEAEKVASAYK